MTATDRYQLQPLLERVLAGDRQAYNQLFRQLRPYLHSLVRRYAGPGAAALGQSDLVQSAQRRLHENFDDLLNENGANVPHLLCWIQRVVRNRVVDEIRKRQRDPLARSPGGPMPDVAESREGPGPAERDTIALRVSAALARLPERQRQVVELHWFDRLPDSEISQRLGGSVGAIRVLRCRALQCLRSYMEAGDENE
jgi:RNA polymerase sigma-70 factor (ECF subfamily)